MNLCSKYAARSWQKKSLECHACTHIYANIYALLCGFRSIWHLEAYGYIHTAVKNAFTSAFCLHLNAATLFSMEKFMQVRKHALHLDL